MSKHLVRSIKHVKQKRNLSRRRTSTLHPLRSVTKTDRGTYIDGNVEYSCMPPPKCLIKAMDSEWAHKLIEQGIIRLNSLTYHQNLERQKHNDSSTVNGTLSITPQTPNANTTNKSFIWCSALPNTKTSVLLGLDETYDVVIKITNIEDFIARITNALVLKGYAMAMPRLGKLSYHHRDAVCEDNVSVNDPLWRRYTFQKPIKYNHQNEFRLVYTDTTSTLSADEPIDLVIGPCADIIEIVINKQDCSHTTIPGAAALAVG